jgi:hypothetical protein
VNLPHVNIQKYVRVSKPERDSTKLNNGYITVASTLIWISTRSQTSEDHFRRERVSYRVIDLCCVRSTGTQLGGTWELGLVLSYQSPVYRRLQTVGHSLSIATLRLQHSSLHLRSTFDSTYTSIQDTTGTLCF